ncbi:hypothetical protein CP965_03730 [Halarcobacter mediterraneus]|uniref:Phage abortive infection protein n=1 Tax=Halarcobacter mediterraneus TaxID=2023153 RepID=A0A4Q1B5Z9_9BACT|nr:putative phage abortive infection protein [Halarcobacter mediterraneus]RXK14567.1 hypothetical protein CP965_03730 [Halarcobacter mediterraneus]
MYKKSTHLLANKIIKISLLLILILIPLTIAYLWQEEFSISTKINHEKLGTFGDFFGGIIGSIWALTGIILFYIALKEQRKDFSNNKKALTKQIEALNLQNDEFKQQKEELRETREVFKEQSKTLKQQRFETTFFSLIDLFNTLVNNLDLKNDNKNYFKKLRDELFTKETESTNIIELNNEIINLYKEILYGNKESLTHYFRTLYRIIHFIDSSELAESEKIVYLKIFRSQLSEYELLLIYYNAETRYAKKLYPLILKYNLIKHLPSLSKFEFYKYTKNIVEDYKKLNKLNQFNEFIFDNLLLFIDNLNQNVNKEDFIEEELSKKTEINDKILIKITSSEINKLKFAFILLEENISDILFFKIEIFKEYFSDLLYDYVLFSRFSKSSDFNICNKTSTIEGRLNLIFEIDSNIKIQLNKDNKRGN